MHGAAVCRITAIVANVILRLASYVYLRWISGPGTWKWIIYLYLLQIASVVGFHIVNGKQPSRAATTSRTEDVNGRHRSRLSRTVIGAPETNSIFTIILNGILVSMVLDYVFRSSLYTCRDAFFCKLGSVTPTSVAMTVREPALFGHVDIYTREKTSGWVLSKSLTGFNEDQDYIENTIIHGLRESTAYEWKAVRAGVDVGENGAFETFPSDMNPRKWSFISSSCTKSNIPYSPWKHPLRMEGVQLLMDRLQPYHKFLMFLGDFIYVEQNDGIKHGTSLKSDLSRYLQIYRQNYAIGWNAISKSLPTFHIYDDHDIANNWDMGESMVFPNASVAYHIYNGASNPEPFRPGVNYYSFSYGDCAFFVMDTRRYRSPNHETDGPKKTMLGIQQREDLLEWAKDMEEQGFIFKFLITSVPFTKNWRGVDGEKDTWGGFLYERQIILDALAGVSNVVAISGDRHEAAITQVGDIIEFSVSPLNQFYLPIRTYSQRDDLDKQIVYFPDGNVKWGEFNIDTEDPRHPKLNFALRIQGKAVWENTFVGKAVVNKSFERSWLKLITKTLRRYVQII